MNFYFPPDFHFEYPLYLLLFLLLIPVGYLVWQTWQYKKRLDQTFYQSYFNQKKEWVNALVLGLGFSGLVFSLMEPLGYRQNEKEQRNTSIAMEQPLPVLFLFDTSLSMTTPDASFNKARFEEGKEIIASFLDDLKPYPKALYVFQDHLQPIIPLTLDDTFIRLTLDALTPNISKDGTEFLRMLDELYKRLNTKEVIKPRQIILISDGEDTGIDPDIRAMSKVVSSLAQEGITFHVIGIGSLEGKVIPGITFDDKPQVSKKNESLLKALAQAGNGQYIDPRKVSVLSLTQSLSQDIAGHTYGKLYAQAPESSYIPLFSIFLLITLLALLRGF